MQDVLDAPEAKEKEVSGIYYYLNYRDYLKDYFVANKKKHKYFNYSHFAKRAGVGSHSYLRMVIHGERNLSSKTIHKFAKAMDLSKKEAAYFETLTQFTQAYVESEKDMYFERLVHLRPRSFLKEVNEDQYEYFTKRHFVTIREMTALKNFREDPEWIGAHVYPYLKPTEVEHAIEVLTRLGLVARDEAGKLSHTKTTLTTLPEMTAMEIYDYNRQLLSEAKDAILNRPRHLVDMVSVTAPIPLAILPELKKIMLKCKDEMLDLICQQKTDYDDVFQFNFQYFPITHAHEDPAEDAAEGDEESEIEE